MKTGNPNVKSYFYLIKHSHRVIFKSIAGFLALTLLTFSSFLFLTDATALAQSPVLPAPGQMVTLSSTYDPILLKGMQFFPNQPLRFDFIVDTGDSPIKKNLLKKECNRLIKYFLTALTIPEEDLWVNLNPYEHNRIIPKEFSHTDMGRDFLAQDYLLKQLTASLIYPEEDIGEEFWDKVYQQAFNRYGIHDIPVETFNKVWIVPDIANIYENKDIAYITQTRLKVMLEQDYIAQKKFYISQEVTNKIQSSKNFLISNEEKKMRTLSSDMIRTIIIPILEEEVNTGSHFQKLRQIYHSIILAYWIKDTLKKSVFTHYIAKNKIAGVDISDKNIKEKIYSQYLEAFKKGTFNFIREDYDPVNQTIIPKKYFAGGFDFLGKIVKSKMNRSSGSDFAMVTDEAGKPKGSLLLLQSTMKPVINHPEENNYAQLNLSLGGDKKEPPEEMSSARIKLTPFTPDLERMGADDLPEQIQELLTDKKDSSLYVPLTISLLLHSIFLGLPLDQSVEEVEQAQKTHTIEVTIVPSKKPVSKLPKVKNQEKSQTDTPDLYLEKKISSPESPDNEVSPHEGTTPLLRETLEINPIPMTIQPISPQTFEPVKTKHVVKVNGYVIYEGSDFGGNTQIYDAMAVDIPAEQNFEIKTLGNNENILVLGFRGDTQGPTLDRMAFYKESPTHKGKVLTNDEIEDVMTYNDYLGDNNFGQRKPSLYEGYNFTGPEFAGFLNAAKAEGVALNEHEQTFRNALLEQGVITDENGEYVAPEQTAIITYGAGRSQDVTQKVKRHELGHALFEIDEEYKKVIEKIWSSLPQQQKELYQKIIDYFGYHPDVSLTEFVEYFENPELLHNRLKAMKSYSRVYSPGAIKNKDQAKLGSEILSEIIEHRYWTSPQTPSGFYYTQNFKSQMTKLVPLLNQAKQASLKRQGLPSLPKSHVKIFNAPLSIDQGIPNIVQNFVSESEFIAIDGNREMLQSEIKRKKLSDAQTDAILANIKQGIAPESPDIYRLTLPPPDKWNAEEIKVEYIRKHDQKPMQESIEDSLRGVNTHNLPQVLNIIEASLSHRQWSDQETLTYQTPVNLNGEIYILHVTAQAYLQESKSKISDIRSNKKWEVNLSLIKKDRSHLWPGHLNESAPSNDPQTSFREAKNRLESSASENALEFKSQNKEVIPSVAEALNRLQKTLGQRTNDNNIEIWKPVQLPNNGPIVDLHLIQEEISDSFGNNSFETRLGLELPQQDSSNGKVLNGLGVIIESPTQLQGLKEAGEELQKKIEYNAQSDQALISDTKGGIDMTREMFNIKTNAYDFQFKIPSYNLELGEDIYHTNVLGFSAEINRMKSIKSLPILLGIQ